MPFEYVLYDMSYANMVLYGSVIPSFDAGDKAGEGSGGGEVIDSRDPRNRERLEEMFDNMV